MAAGGGGCVAKGAAAADRLEILRTRCHASGEVSNPRGRGDDGDACTVCVMYTQSDMKLILKTDTYICTCSCTDILTRSLGYAHMQSRVRRMTTTILAKHTQQ